MDQYSLQYSSQTILDSSLNSSLFNKYYYSSWQEQAVLVWPPRCYCCSFCKREFRSAQALGGHMNVHRKDRARLKHQSQNQAHDEPLSKSQGKATTLSKPQKQSPADLNSKPVALTTNLSTLSWGEPTNFSHLASPEIKKRHSHLKRGDEKIAILLDDDDYVEENLSAGISIAASEYSKRQKCSMFSSFPLLHKPYCWSDKYCLSNNNILSDIPQKKSGISTSSMEDIDLELRLGDPPAISS